MNLSVCRHIWRTTFQFSRLLRQAKGADHLSPLHFLPEALKHFQCGQSNLIPPSDSRSRKKVENLNNRTIFAEWTYDKFG